MDGEIGGIHGVMRFMLAGLILLVSLRTGYANDLSELQTAKTRGRIHAQHQVQVLDRSARRAFAKIVINRDKQDLRLVVVGKNMKAHVIGTVQALRIDSWCSFMRRERRDRNKTVCDRRIMIAERRMQLFTGWYFLQALELQGNCGKHAFEEIAHCRHEQRRFRKLRVQLHLGQMFVCEGQSIRHEIRCCRAFGLIVGNH